MALDFGKLNFSTSFNPTSAFPIDARTYFESYDLAVEAAGTAEEAGSANTTYYYGQILVVNEGGAVAAYQITPAKALQKLAATTSSGDLAQDVLELQGKVSALEGNVSTLSSGLSSLSGTVTTLSEGLATVSGNVTTLSSQLGTLSETVGTLSTGLGTVSSGLSTLSGTVSTLSGKVGANETAISTLSGKVSTNETAISGLTGRVTTAESDIDALQAQITGLTGAMHFIGTSTTDPTEGATVSGHEEFKSGDVCLFGNKEYVYNGSAWLELGDEGSHLTKTEAESTYVKKTFNLNGHTLSGASLSLTAADVGADASGAAEGVKTELDGKITTLSGRVDQLETDKVVASDITDAINALDVAAVAVGAGETVKSISETDGKIAIEKQAIQVAQSQVTGLESALAGKQDTITVSGNGILTVSEGVFGVDTNTYATTSSVESSISTAIDDLDLANTYLGLHAKADSAANADKVAHKLTVGSKEFDGSAEVTVTATDLGALTAIPQATAEALGGIKLGHTEGANEHAVVLDGEGKAYVTVSIPAAVTYSAGAGLTLSGTTFAIANGGVTVSMLAGGITDDKLVSLDVQKLTQKEEDTLIIDGGTAE